MAKRYTTDYKRSWPRWFCERVSESYWKQRQEQEEKEFGFIG